VTKRWLKELVSSHLFLEERFLKILQTENNSEISFASMKKEWKE
jgi:hypothetical protein